MNTLNEIDKSIDEAKKALRLCNNALKLYNTGDNSSKFILASVDNLQKYISIKLKKLDQKQMEYEKSLPPRGSLSALITNAIIEQPQQRPKKEDDLIFLLSETVFFLCVHSYNFNPLLDKTLNSILRKHLRSDIYEEIYLNFSHMSDRPNMNSYFWKKKHSVILVPSKGTIRKYLRIGMFAALIRFNLIMNMPPELMSMQSKFNKSAHSNSKNTVCDLLAAIIIDIRSYTEEESISELEIVKDDRRLNVIEIVQIAQNIIKLMGFEDEVIKTFADSIDKNYFNWLESRIN